MYTLTWNVSHSSKIDPGLDPFLPLLCTSHGCGATCDLLLKIHAARLVFVVSAAGHWTLENVTGKKGAATELELRLARVAEIHVSIGFQV